VEGAGRLVAPPVAVGVTPAPVLDEAALKGAGLAELLGALWLAWGAVGAGVWTLTRTTRVRVRQRTTTRGLAAFARLWATIPAAGVGCAGCAACREAM
jgi:hypothetical protein